jgi:two-component system response regulator HydG
MTYGGILFDLPPREPRILHPDARTPSMVLIGTSRPFTELLEDAQRVSSSDATVLLSGEMGTGKDALARAIHAASPRRRAPFVPLDCASIPENLLEAELFGHEVGAFTGAERRRSGRFREAHGGTLYLDGSHNMSFRLQARLLRALEQREVLPLGATRPQRVDFRIVAAAPPDLAERVVAGTFREDLFYRLKVVELRLPPLRERREDIPPLTQLFLRELARAYCKPARRLAPEVYDLLGGYSWPGNVRELRNVVEAALATARGETVTESDLPLWFRVAAARPAELEPPPSEPRSRGGLQSSVGGRLPTFREQVSAFQRQIILKALGRHLWDFRRAGRELGIERHQLKYLCAKLDIRRPRL